MLFIDFETTGLPVQTDDLLAVHELNSVDKRITANTLNLAMINFNNNKIADSVLELYDSNNVRVEVLSLTVTVTDDNFKVLESLTRYYYHTAKAEEISGALAVNKLTHARVNELRDQAGITYAPVYLDDISFWYDHLMVLSKCGHSRMYAHKIDFDKLFLPVGFWQEFQLRCSMQAAMAFFNAKKRITLSNACKLFDIDVTADLTHTSSYDIELLIKLMQKIKTEPRYRKVISMSNPVQKKSSLNNYRISIKFMGVYDCPVERLMLINVTDAFSLMTAQRLNPDAVTYHWVKVNSDSSLELSRDNPYLAKLQELKLC